MMNEGGGFNQSNWHSEPVIDKKQNKKKHAHILYSVHKSWTR